MSPHMILIRGASLWAYGTAIRQLPDLLRAGQVGGLRRDSCAGDDG
jgi:hypothetical protein